MDHDEEIYEQFGVLDEKIASTKFTDDAREVSFVENTLIVPCSELSNFLIFRYTRSYGDYFDAKSHVRSLIVKVYYEKGDCDNTWVFRGQVLELRKLLDCPRLQKLELLLCGPGGLAADPHIIPMTMEIMDIGVGLWKRLGRGMKT